MSASINPGIVVEYLGVAASKLVVRRPGWHTIDDYKDASKVVASLIPVGICLYLATLPLASSISAQGRLAASLAALPAALLLPYALIKIGRQGWTQAGLIRGFIVGLGSSLIVVSHLTALSMLTAMYLVWMDVWFMVGYALHISVYAVWSWQWTVLAAAAAMWVGGEAILRLDQ